MHSVRVAQPGGPESMQVVESATPEPGAGEARVRVTAAGVNFIDVYQRSGFYPVPRPIRLGLEGAGVVEAVGAGVTDVRAGDRVAWAGVPGSYATHVIADAKALVPVPQEVDLRIAAAAMLQGMTAHYLARSTYALKAGDTCIVHAAAGGVGLLLCQMAKASGARVFGVVSTDEKAARARAAGADEILLSGAGDLAAEVRRRTAGRGVDVVYDSVGKATFEASLASIRPRGLLVLFGQSSGAVPPLDVLTLSARGSLYVTRPKLADYTATRAELLARGGDVLAAIAAGRVSITVFGELPLARAAEAHTWLESRVTSGKVLLLPS